MTEEKYHTRVTKWQVTESASRYKQKAAPLSAFEEVNVLNGQLLVDKRNLATNIIFECPELSSLHHAAEFWCDWVQVGLSWPKHLRSMHEGSQ